MHIRAACLLAMANCRALHVHPALAIMYGNQRHQIIVKATVSAHLNIGVHVMNPIEFSALINHINSTLQVSSYKAASPVYSLPTSLGDLKS